MIERATFARLRDRRGGKLGGVGCSRADSALDCLAEVEQGFGIGSAFTDHFVCAWPGRAKTVVLYRFNEHRDFPERPRHIVSRDHTRLLPLARCTRNAAARTVPAPETRWLTAARPE
jgi:hypothetical protein